MSFFLTEDQEGLVNEFLDRENRKICEKQLESEEIPEEFKDLIRKTIETDSPLPFFNPGIGYYSISFTPVDKGNRIYIHHHLTNVSEAIYDPSRIVVDDGEEETPAEEVEVEEVIHPTAEMDYQELKSELPDHTNYDLPENTEQFKEQGFYIPSNE